MSIHRMNPPDIARELADSLGADPDSFRFLRHSQNFVFRYIDRDGCERILRATSHTHRSPAEIAAELDWIDWLHKAGAPVCPPLPLGGRRIFTVVHDEECFHCVAFEMAKGKPVSRASLGPALDRLHGQTLGKLHRLAIEYPPARMAARKIWKDERYFSTDIDRYVPAEFRTPLEHAFANLRARADSTPRSPRTSGAIHFDLGYSNFLLDGDRLTVFDFDNCALAPFVADIAAALYSSIFTLARCEFPGDRSAFAPPKSSRILAETVPAFREGYTSEFPWPEDDENHLQSWLDVMYFRTVIHAWRLQFPVPSPPARDALLSDIGNLLAGRTPVSI